MTFDESYIAEVFSRFRADGLNSLSVITRGIADALDGADIDKCVKDAESRVIDTARRYGKGAELLGPFGYFHPSAIISVITDNAKRGRLLKKSEGCIYSYDFDANGDVALIRYPSNSTVTICHKNENTWSYVTYQITHDTREIVDVTFTENGANKLLNAMLRITWFDGMKDIGDIYIETYEQVANDMRICSMRDIILSDVKKRTYACFLRKFKVMYDEALNIVDWENFGAEETGSISL